MRQRLLQHLSFAKPLRLALVLSTLLLTLPQTAWGDNVLYTFGSAPGGNGGLANAGTGKYTISSTSGEGWTITDLRVDPNRTNWVASSDSLKIYDIPYYGTGTSNPATTVDFELTSDFTLTGTFVSAEVEYCTENMASKTVTIYRDGANNLTSEKVTLGATPTTISLNSTYKNVKIFNGNKIAFHFYFTTNTSGGTLMKGSFTIKSIKITTTPFTNYGITIVHNNTSYYVTDANESDILGDDTYTVSYTGGKLCLNNATINGKIRSYGALSIDLSGESTITSDSVAIKNTDGNNSRKLWFYSNSGNGIVMITTTTAGSPCIQDFDFEETSSGKLLLGTLTAYTGTNPTAIVGAKYWDGTGSTSDPYRITTIDQLRTFSQYVNNGTAGMKGFCLYSDIDCTSLTDLQPIGTSEHPFTGYFNGYERTLSNLTINGNGLFGEIGNNAVINYLILKDCTINGTGYAGAIVGKNNLGQIRNCRVKGTTTVYGTNPGAIIGDNSSIPEASISTYLENNYYDYTVTTQATGGDSSTGYTARGVGNPAGDLTTNNAAVLYTQVLTLSATTNGTISAWYTPSSQNNDGKFAPGQTAYIKATPTDGYSVTSISVTYTNSTQQTITPTFDATNSTSTDKFYYFDMPDANDATASVTFGVVNYDLTVAGTAITSVNASAITGTGISGTVSFDGDNNILSLNGATIDGRIVWSGTTNLTIDVSGTNEVSHNFGGVATESVIYSTNASCSLTVKKNDNAESATLKLASYDNAGNNGSVISNFASSDNVNLKYALIVSQTNIEYACYSTEIYDLSVGGYKVHDIAGLPGQKDKILGDEKVSYNKGNNTLTLNGATVGNYGIVYDGTPDLNIALNGTVSVTGSTYAFYSNGGVLKFVKSDGASSVELTATCGLGHHPIELSRSTLGSGLYWKPIEDTQTIITDNPEFVIVGDFFIPNASPVAGDQGEIRYDATNKILTLDGYSKAYATGKHAIKTGVTDLKVKLIGENTISCISDSAIFYPFSNSASIQLVKNDNTSKLTMTGKALDYFAADKISYDGLVYYSSNTNNYIAIPTAPTMDVDNNNKVVLTIDYSGGSVATKYSIDYADETADVTDATYSAPFEMAAPGTVTAWVVANGTTTSTVKGKRFGYQGGELSMLVQEELTPVLIPSIESGDNIGYVTSTSPYTINDASVATIDNNGKITALAIGAATLTTQLAYASNLPHTTTILNYDKKFTTQLTVSKVFNVTFAEGANYMIYYNSAHDNLTIPDGMTAAIVTGVSSSGTTVETTALTYIPETTAVLLGKGTSTGSLTVTKYITKDPAPTGNKLKYVDNTPVATTGYEYILYKDEFVKATGSIPDGKCYLDLTGAAPAPAPARSLGIDNDGTTDIRELRMENEERDEWYDLQGRRIEQPTKAGLYIKNGKKVIVNTK